MLSLSQCTVIVNACFVADEKHYVLTKISEKNELHEALEKERFGHASQLIATQSEARLMECFEGKEGSVKSCLHFIAAISDTAEATKLCRQLMQRIQNTRNKECLLNAQTVEEFDMGGWTVGARVAAIHIAAYSGNSGVVRVLCQDYRVDANCSTSETLEEQPKKSITPLEWAARKGHTEVVKVLTENNADINARRPTDGVSALYVAAQNGYDDIVKLLLENSADVNARRHTDGATALHIASWNGNGEIVRMLLGRDAEVDARCSVTGATALHNAAKNGHSEIVQMLLQNHADVNASTRTDGSTALHAAAWNGHVEMVKLLLDNAADVNAKTRQDATAQQMAAQNGHTEVVQLLSSHC